MSEDKVSRAETIAASAVFEIECPSGNKYLVRKGSPREVMMLTGELPVDRALGPDEEAEPDAPNPALVVLDTEIAKSLETSRRFLESYCVDPVVVFLDYPAKGDPAKAEVAYWQVSGDVTHLVGEWIKVCMGTLTPEGGTVPFRDGLGSSDTRPAGTEVQDGPARDSES